jgi:hypothetical protein
MANKYLALLDKHPAMKVNKIDPYSEGVRTHSPSVNFIFGNTHLIPFRS